MSKRTIIILIVLAGALGIISYMWRGSTAQSNHSQSKVAGSKAISKDAVIYDVRTPEEYAASHAEGAVNLPLQDLQDGKLPSDAKGTPIYLYCRSGNRSAQAMQVLRGAGFTNVTDIGGLTKLTDYGLKVVQ